MPVTINFLTEEAEWRDALKLNRAQWKKLMQAALVHAPIELPDDIAINVLLGDDATVQRLNRDYRDKDKPTNILSFPQIDDWSDDELVEELMSEPELELGDLVLGWGVCSAESADQGKTIRDHVGHLLVHGTLHLLGYDHMDDGEAAAMEALETAILAAHDIADPYLET